MALASQFHGKRDIPHEANEWIEFRGLGHLDLKAARDAMIRDWRFNAQYFGKDLYEVATRPRPEIVASTAPADPYNMYDHQTILDHGVLAWSYGLHLPARTTDPDKRAQQEERMSALGELDEKTTEWAVRTLLHGAMVDNAWGTDKGETEAADDGNLSPTHADSWSPSIVS